MNPTASNGSPGEIVWLPWGRDAFVRAATHQIPVLLSIGASWCRWSAEMTRTTYGDPDVRELIARRFVPVWVDTDRRPDINERYNLGGWPTTAFLSPDGQVLGGETYVQPDRMKLLLQRVAEAYGGRRDRIEGSDPPTGVTTGARCPVEFDPGDDSQDTDLVVAFESHLVSEFDAVHGGFGTEMKRVQAPAVEFALKRVAAGHGELWEVAKRTLDVIGWSDVYDAVDGGVFRYCAGRDWTVPQVEKLAEVNAEVLELLVDGWVVLGAERYRDRAIHLLRYIGATLVDPDDGGFYTSQFADDDYYDATAAERANRMAPPVDRSVYADTTARMAAACFRAAQALDDTSLLEWAVTAMERVVGATYQRGLGIAHAADEAETTRGWLRDQVLASDALIDAYLATDREVYLDTAQELMRFAMRNLWDAETGEFIDRVAHQDDVGLLQEPLKPFASNCLAARVLARLGRLSGNDEYRSRAKATLTTQRPSMRARGVDAAPWALAALELRV